MLKYTLAFIFHDDQVLMLLRNNAPNKHLLNGVGGKLEPGETPSQCILREIHEEVGIQINHVQFAGVVTWGGAAETGEAGMYVYFADWPEELSPDTIRGRCGDEGSLDWFTLDYVCTNPDQTVVDNIPHFLPQMLRTRDGKVAPRRHHCHYRGWVLEKVSHLPLPVEILDEATALETLG
ncbi:MAG: NUDIX hydrolase [Bacillota bacterium]